MQRESSFNVVPFYIVTQKLEVNLCILKYLHFESKESPQENYSVFCFRTSTFYRKYILQVWNKNNFHRILGTNSLLFANSVLGL